MMWFQNGKLWPSRLDAQEAMRARGEMGRRGDERQGGFRDRTKQQREDVGRPLMGRRGEPKDHGEKLEWKPKGEFTPAPRRADPSTRERFRDAKSSARSGQGKPAWRPKQDVGRPLMGRRGERKDRRERPEKLEWKPRGEGESPKTEARRPKTWRPGGDHKDPRQKYKDAKKAKWTRFKQGIRKRWESKQGKKKGDK
jgi:hypothetical protein